MPLRLQRRIVNAFFALAIVAWVGVIVTILLPAKSANPQTAVNNVPPLNFEHQAPPLSSDITGPVTKVVPILMYHYIRDYTDPNDPLGIQLSVSPLKFDEQLTILEKAGYQTISLMDYVTDRLKPKSIILTFDDGYDDHYSDALPILQKHHMTGTFFIVKNFIGRVHYMTQSQIEVLRSAGMEIAAHSMNHKNLASLNVTQATAEIKGSLPGTEPVFAYPSGNYNDQTIEILRTLGLEAAVSTHLGVASSSSDLLLLPRIRVKEHLDILKVIINETYYLTHPRPVTPTPSPTIELSPSPTLTPSPTPSPSPSPSPTATQSATPTKTPTPKPTVSPTATRTPRG